MNLSGPQRKFVEGIVSGLTDAEAYAAAFPKSKHPRQDAARLRSDKNPTKTDIEAEIARLRGEAEKAAGGCVLTLAIKRKFYYDVVMTPVGSVNESSYLCQEFTRTRRTDGRGDDAEDWETEKIKMPDKLKATELDAKLAGEFTDKLQLSADDDLTSLMKLVNGCHAERTQ